MITQKKMIIPIFDYNLTVIIYDDWNDVKHLDINQDRNYPPKGFTQWQYGAALVAVDSKHVSTIVHEAEHVKNLIWEYIGYKPQADNDEIYAYLLTYLYDRILEVLNKHIKATK